MAQGIGNCCSAHICKSCSGATQKLTAVFPHSPPLPSLPFLLCFWNTPISGKKSHPICQRNMLRDWSSGNLFHVQFVNGPTENFRVLNSQSPKVNRALITQPKAFSPSFHSWSKALPRLSFPTLLSPFQGPSLHPVRSKDLMSPRQLPPPYTHWATRPFLMVSPSTKYPHEVPIPPLRFLLLTD